MVRFAKKFDMIHFRISASFTAPRIEEAMDCSLAISSKSRSCGVHNQKEPIPAPCDVAHNGADTIGINLHVAGDTIAFDIID